MKPLYDVKSTAQLLGVSTWTVRGYIRQGKLHPVRIGRLVRFEEEELSRFVASGKSDNGFSNQIQSGAEQ
jgi:excisionase family DNA binding protein